MKLALLIIDVQKAYYTNASQASIDAAVEYINEVIPYFRKAGLPVVWIQDIDEGSSVVPGTPGFEWIDALSPQPGDHTVHKKYGNSFNKTELLIILKQHDIDTVVITGYSAEYCVLSTYRGAQDADLTPVMLQHGIASASKENLDLVMKISNCISYNMLGKILAG